ncbi:unnamed protein product [Kluyveromyces dobzhanskii CBS 2104]|uniref:WGS project CCBQ000000000 data, contig 00011 n=1 Tax=Kluyveromyces dobzhanskii CBS 2104 TaxID=1427455 RepID=A0A0A8L9N0_9SACH|nr:unnamed protein product [Kluyveromyces dobzhanskii CBS 2104]
MSDKVEDVAIDVDVDSTEDKKIGNVEEPVAESVSEAVADKSKASAEKEPVEKGSAPVNSGAEVQEKEEDQGKEAAPPLPVRKSVSPEVEADKENPMMKQLKEAFPSIDERYVKAVLIASQGKLDPAFNALLFLSDPNFEKEAPLPTRPVEHSTHGERRQLTQLEQDELLARQLDKKFNKHGHSSGERTAREQRIRQREREYERQYGSTAPRRRRDSDGYDNFNDDADEEDDVFSTFVDKDLPQIRDNLNRNIQETGKKISSWFSGITKNLVDDDANYSETRQRRSQSRFNSFGDRYRDGNDELDGPTKLQNAGISLQNDELDFGSDDDIPPRLPTRAKKVVAETTYIDTPEQVRGKNSRSPVKTIPPHIVSPSKVNSESKLNTSTAEEPVPKTVPPITSKKDTETGITLEDQDIITDSDLDI